VRAHVWAELIDDKIVRIFKSRAPEAFSKALLEDRVRQVARSYAVSEIRKEVFRLAEGKCKYCGGTATDMHEEKLRSLGGEISIWNSCACCRKCHQKVGHKNRVLHWS
jgi:hypothetical protein